MKSDSMCHHVDFICFKTKQSWLKIFKRETIILHQDKSNLTCADMKEFIFIRVILAETILISFCGFPK